MLATLATQATVTCSGCWVPELAGAGAPPQAAARTPASRPAAIRLTSPLLSAGRRPLAPSPGSRVPRARPIPLAPGLAGGDRHNLRLPFPAPRRRLRPGSGAAAPAAPAPLLHRQAPHTAAALPPGAAARRWPA